MKLKRVLLLVSIILLNIEICFAQASGNINYGVNPSVPNYNHSTKIPSAQMNLPFQAQDDMIFTINGLYNCKADSYLAIFSVTQVGKTQKEVNQLIAGKIDSITAGIKRKGKKVEIHVDMISFVPVYEYVVEKKLFSKKTYNEIPKGFELKKNIHFQFSDPELINFLVETCSEQEIYDLVRVDYVVMDMELKKEEMILKAKKALDKKINRYKGLMSLDYANKRRMATDGFEVHYPVEQYSSYQAYCSNSINVKPGANVNTIGKATSSFYMPKLNKNYDIVINPAILEPVVQIEYQLKVRLYPKPKEEKPKEVKPIVKIEKQVVKDIFIVTPDAKVQKLNIP